MKNRFLFILCSAVALSTSAFAANEAPANMGIVNFGSCVTDSKIGKQEQASFEALKKQMATLLEDTEKQLNEINAKFNDPEYLDGLSPEGEEELKTKFRTLSEELNRYQNQYYQVLNQANMRIIQQISGTINAAAEKVAKEKKLTMVVNKEACFFFNPQLEITNLVVAEMDKMFETESKKQAPAAPAAAAPQAETAQAPAVETKSEAKVK
jgi:outer membrane protein